MSFFCYCLLLRGDFCYSMLFWLIHGSCFVCYLYCYFFGVLFFIVLFYGCCVVSTLVHRLPASLLCCVHLCCYAYLLEQNHLQYIWRLCVTVSAPLSCYSSMFASNCLVDSCWLCYFICYFLGPFWVLVFFCPCLLLCSIQPLFIWPWLVLSWILDGLHPL